MLALLSLLVSTPSSGTLINGLENVSLLSTPGERINPRDFNGNDEEELTGAKATMFRAMAARGNYMSIDRTDIRFAAKETDSNETVKQQTSSRVVLQESGAKHG